MSTITYKPDRLSSVHWQGRFILFSSPGLVNVVWLARLECGLAEEFPWIEVHGCLPCPACSLAVVTNLIITERSLQDWVSSEKRYEVDCSNCSLLVTLDIITHTQFTCELCHEEVFFCWQPWEYWWKARRSELSWWRWTTSIRELGINDRATTEIYTADNWTVH